MGTNYSVFIKTEKSLTEVKSCLENFLNSTLERSESDLWEIYGTILFGLNIGLVVGVDYEDDFIPLSQYDYEITIDYIRPDFTGYYNGEWDKSAAVIIADGLSKKLYCECIVVRDLVEIIDKFISEGVLSEIFELKKHRVYLAKWKRDFQELKKSATEIRKNAEKYRLRTALQKKQINIIAEIKRASPSKGVINDKIDVAETARSYENGGACAISVLTEEDKFCGSLEDLKIARKAVNLPILRKDFIFDEFQIYEAAESGADVILLIAAMLDDEVLQKLHHLAEIELGLDALVEVHTLEELQRVKKINAKIIGVNNRDLHSFKVSLDVSKELIKHAPDDALMITESGIRTKEEILELKNLGFSGFLIGETLMRSGNAAEALRELATNEHEKPRK